MKLYIQLISSIIITLHSSTCFTAEHEETPQEPSMTNEHMPFILSDDTRLLLSEEMKALQNGMKEIVPALVSGEWKKIKSIGEQMHDSYIMKKSLTRAQLHELHEKLPAAFKQLDHDFHHSAGQLAEAANRRDYELVSFYYYKMTEACVECHTRYATHKFPEFARPAEHEEDNH